MYSDKVGKFRLECQIQSEFASYHSFDFAFFNVAKESEEGKAMIDMKKLRRLGNELENEMV
jgi:hypothetical protein